MTIKIMVNIGSGNGLLPDGTKPSPEAILIFLWSGSVAFTYESKFTVSAQVFILYNEFKNDTF